MQLASRLSLVFPVSVWNLTICSHTQLLKGVDLPPPELTELDLIIEGRKLLDGPPGGRGRGGGMNDHGMRTSQHVMPVGGGLVGSTPLGRMLAAGLSGPPTPGYGGMGMGMGMGGYGGANVGMVAATGAYGVGYSAMSGGSGYGAPSPNMGGAAGYGGQQHYGAQSGGYGRQQNSRDYGGSGAQSYSGAPGGGYGGYGGAPAQNTYGGGSGGYGPQGGSSLLHQLGNSFGNGEACRLLHKVFFQCILRMSIYFLLFKLALSIILHRTCFVQLCSCI
jgi:hypothetical protein